MAKIINVSFDYDDNLPVFGASVIIHLDNKQSLFLSIESKAAELVKKTVHPKIWKKLEIGSVGEKGQGWENADMQPEYKAEYLRSRKPY